MRKPALPKPPQISSLFESHSAFLDRHPEHIRIQAVVIPKLELRDIERQMPFLLTLWNIPPMPRLMSAQKPSMAYRSAAHGTNGRRRIPSLFAWRSGARREFEVKDCALARPPEEATALAV